MRAQQLCAFVVLTTALALGSAIQVQELDLGLTLDGRNFVAQQATSPQPGQTTVAGQTRPPRTTVPGHGETLPPRTTVAGQTTAGETRVQRPTGDGQTTMPGQTTAAPVAQCDRAALQTAYANVIAVCAHVNFADLGRLNSNITFDQINRMCGSPCLDAAAAVMTDMPACFSRRERLEMQAVRELCRPVNDNSNSSCAAELRWLHAYDCDRWQGNRTGCNTMSGGACSYVLDNNKWKCELRPSPVHLNRMCTPCFRRFLNVYTALDRNADATLLTLQYNSVCAKHGQRWCYPLVVPFPSNLFGFGNANLTAPVLNGMVDQVCAAPTCLHQVYGNVLGAGRHQARLQYRTCARNATRQAGDATMARNRVERECFRPLDRQLEEYQKLENFITGVCKRNHANTSCWVKAHEVYSTPCHYAIDRSNVCPAACAAWASNFTASAGCCLGVIENLGLSRRHVSYPAALVPTVNISGAPVQFEQNATQPAFRGLSTSTVFRNYTVCPALNNTLFAMRVSGSCRRLTRPAPRRFFVIRGLRWTAIRNNAALRQRIVDALVRDLAAAIGIPTTDIVNATLEEDSSVTVSRRQSESGVRLSFQIAADSDADADALAAQFDQLAASGALVTPSAADVITSDCTDCVSADFNPFANATLTTPAPSPGATPNPNSTTPTTQPPITPTTGPTTAPSSTSISAAAGTQAVAVLVAAAVFAAFTL